MNRLSWLLGDADLLLLIEVLMPEYRDKQKMLEILKEDDDILEGMLTDERFFEHLMKDPESLIKVSPHLFFTVLLNRVKQDLKQRPYTIERQNHHQMAVFDSGGVVDLLNLKNVRNYLTDMLVSFVRINSFTVLIQVRRGKWRRFKFSDFDIDALIKYSQTVEEEFRFQFYKRIADICLFIAGIFPDSFDTVSQRSRYRHLGKVLRQNRQEFSEQGKYFYGVAAKHKVAKFQELNQVLQNLSDNFSLAAKPLAFMTDHYLGFVKDNLFLQ